MSQKPDRISHTVIFLLFFLPFSMSTYVTREKCRMETTCTSRWLYVTMRCNIVCIYFCPTELPTTSTGGTLLANKCIMAWRYTIPHIHDKDSDTSKLWQTRRRHTKPATFQRKIAASGGTRCISTVELFIEWLNNCYTEGALIISLFTIPLLPVLHITSM